MARRRSRGLSEVVSALLLALVVVSLGAVVAFRYYESWSKAKIGGEAAAERAKLAASEAVVAPLYCHYNVTSKKLVLVVAAGPSGAEVSSVYVNGALAYEAGPGGSLLLEGGKVSALEVSAPNLALKPGDKIEVLIYTRGGNVAACSGEAS